MLTALLAWTYISMICLCWGHIALHTLARVTDMDNRRPDPSLLCLTGLAIIGIIALTISIFMPLDWKAHLFILLPAIIYILKKEKRKSLTSIFTDLIPRARAPRPAGLIPAWPPLTKAPDPSKRIDPIGPMDRIANNAPQILFAACIFLLLLMSSHEIIHPDTLNYHALSILQFDRYTPIPGLANIRCQFGFQNAWFASLAIFNIDTPETYNLIFLNGTVLLWFCSFMVRKISGPTPWPWLILLAFSLLCWLQFRLTAVSASPDFITAIFIWAAFYAWNTDKTQLDFGIPMMILFSFAAVLTKLSALPILALPAFAVLHHRRLKKNWQLFSLGTFGLLVLCTRNYITSGHPFYPFGIPNLFYADWQMRSPDLAKLRHYITAFARTPIEEYAVDPGYNPAFTEWLPSWWSYLSIADRTLMIFTLAGIPTSYLLWMTKKKKSTANWRIPTIIAVLGTIAWSLGAPDPRFGYGFLIPLAWLFYKRMPAVSTRLYPTIAAWIITMSLGAYSIYRIKNFFKPSELLLPAGIVTQAYAPVGCPDCKIDFPNDRITPPPAANETRTPKACCPNIFPRAFSPRAKGIQDGFKPSE